MSFAKNIKIELILDLVVLVVGIAFISLFYRDNILLTGLLIISWFFGLKFWHKRHDIYFFLTGAIIGAVCEIVCISFGVWQYANPTFLGIPLWLPFVWGLATMLIKRIAEIFVKIETRK